MSQNRRRTVLVPLGESAAIGVAAIMARLSTDHGLAGWTLTRESEGREQVLATGGDPGAEAPPEAFTLRLAEETGEDAANEESPEAEGTLRFDGWPGEAAAGGLDIDAALPLLQAVRSLVGLDRTVLRLRQRADAVEIAARLDPLTGVLNRRGWVHATHREQHKLEERGGEAGVLVIDLDGLKAVNDVGGHEAGDRLIHRAAEVLHDAVRGNDTVARLGGDEFVVLLGDAPAPAHLAALAQKLLDGVHTPLTLASGQTLAIGASIGIARCPEDGTTARALLASADQAMYEAKAAGRGGFHFASPLITADAAEADQAFSR